MDNINGFWKYDRMCNEWRRYLLLVFQQEYRNHVKFNEWSLLLRETYMSINYKKSKFKWIAESIIENLDMRSDYLWQNNANFDDWDYIVETVNDYKVLIISITVNNLGSIRLPLVSRKL